MSTITPSVVPCVADTVVLAMFVDSGNTKLLSALAGGSIIVPPTVLDPTDIPPFASPPISEFATGLYAAQQDPSRALLATRARNRAAFVRSRARGVWRPVELSPSEFRLAHYLTTRDARDDARRQNPQFKAKRIAFGEAECAAVAINRGWTLWTDDQSIVELVRTLHPNCQVERLCGLLVRATREELIPCNAARHLYNDIFKGQLNLWSTLELHCNGNAAECRRASN